MDQTNTPEQINYYVSLDLGSDSMVAAFYDATDFEKGIRLLPLQEKAADYVRGRGDASSTKVVPLLELEGKTVSCRLKTRISLVDERQPQQIEADHAKLNVLEDVASASPQKSIFRFFHVKGGIILQSKLMPNPKIPFQMGAREVFPRVRSTDGGNVDLAPDVLLKHLTSQVLRSFVLPSSLLNHIKDPTQSVCLLLTVPNVYSVTHKQALREFLEAQNIVKRVEVVGESDAVAYSVFTEFDGASPEFTAFKSNLHQKFAAGQQRLLTIDVGRGTTDLSLIEWQSASKKGERGRHLALARAGKSEGGNTLSHILARYYQGRIRSILEAEGYVLPFDLLAMRPSDNPQQRAIALAELERLIEAVKRGFKTDLTNSMLPEAQKGFLKNLAQTITQGMDFSHAKTTLEPRTPMSARRKDSLREVIATMKEQQEDSEISSTQRQQVLENMSDLLQKEDLEEALPSLRKKLARLRAQQTNENTPQQNELHEEVERLTREVAQSNTTLNKLLRQQRQRQLSDKLQDELLLPVAPAPVVDAPPAVNEDGWMKRAGKVLLLGGAREAGALAADATRAAAQGLKAEIERSRMERARIATAAVHYTSPADFKNEIGSWEELLIEIRAHIQRSVVALIDETFRLASNAKTAQEGHFAAPNDCWVLVAGQASQFAPLQKEIQDALTKRKVGEDRRLFLSGPLAKYACCLGAIEYEHSGSKIIDQGFFGTLGIQTPIPSVGPDEKPFVVLDGHALTSPDGCTVEFHHLARRRLMFFPKAAPVGDAPFNPSDASPLAHTAGQSTSVHVRYDVEKAVIFFDGKPVTVPTYGNTQQHIWSQVWPDMLPHKDDDVFTEGEGDDGVTSVPSGSHNQAAPPSQGDDVANTAPSQSQKRAPTLALPLATLDGDGWDEVDNDALEFPDIPRGRDADGNRGRGNKKRR